MHVQNIQGLIVNIIGGPTRPSIEQNHNHLHFGDELDSHMSSKIMMKVSTAFI